MRVISRARLRAFWEQPGREDAKEPLLAWYHIASDADWQSWADMAAVFPKASLVGNCVVFNIGGNKYRLATRIIYAKHRVYVLKVMTHAEYDDQKKWQKECGCHEPPPSPAKRPDSSRRTPRKKQR
jgi:mRNA interferase HigB